MQHYVQKCALIFTISNINDFFSCLYIHTAMAYFENEYLVKLPVNYSSKAKLIENEAIIHVEFIHIHPFREGNGRASLVFANLICERAGFKAINFENFRRNYYEKYIEALNSGDNKDYMPMIKIIEGLM